MIRTQQSSQSIVPEWVKWTGLGFLVLGLLCSIAVYWFYTGIVEEKRKGFAASEQVALEETALIDINSIQRYNGNEVFHIVSGTEETGSQGYAVIRKEDAKLEIYLEKRDIVEAAVLKEGWQENCYTCEWIDIKLGLEEGRPIWEITYIDEQGRYVLAHYDAKSGERYQQFAFKRS